MKDMDKKFIQLYGKEPSAIFSANSARARYKYGRAKIDFALGYQCGFDAYLEIQMQEDDYQEEMLENLDLERGG